MCNFNNSKVNRSIQLPSNLYFAIICRYYIATPLHNSLVYYQTTNNVIVLVVIAPVSATGAKAQQFQDLPTDSDLCQNYMKQVVLKPKNLNTVQPIQILRHGKIMLVEAKLTDQDLETATENAYQEMDPEDPVFVISQKISNGKHHSQQHLLSDYSLKNERLYFNNKLFLSNQEPLRHRILQESHNQPMTGHPGVAKTYKILQW